MFRIAEVALRVRDLSVSSRFYMDMLGFTEHKREDGVIFLEVGPLDTELGAVGHPQLLALFDRGAVAGADTSTFDHIAFEIEPSRYDAERRKFQDLNMIVRERSWPDSLPWKGRSFFFRDPDGHVIEVIAANSGG